VLLAAENEVGVSWLADAGPTMVWVVVLSFVFVECALIIGLFLPGDTLLLAAGVILANHNAEASAWWLSLVSLLVAIVAYQVAYVIGRTSGTKFVARRGGKILNQQNLDKARAFLDRRGLAAIILARWLPWVRTFAPLIAGAARMNYRRFVVATVIGAVLWVPTLVLLGYYGGDLLEAIPWLQTVVVWVSIVLVLAGTVYGVWRYRQEISKPLEEEPSVR
jgi:membrane-associated protein